MKAVFQLIDALIRPDRWPLFAVLASAALLLGAIAFEVFGNYPPCPLCIEQRWIHIWVLIVGAVGFTMTLAIRAMGPKVARDAADVMEPVVHGSRLQRFWLALRVPAGVAFVFCLVLSAIFAWSAYAGGFHAGVEYGWWTYDCQTVDTSDISIDDVLGTFNTPVNVVLCDEAAWRMFGISMAGYNFLFSAVCALMSLIAAFRTPSWRQEL